MTDLGGYAKKPTANGDTCRAHDSRVRAFPAWLEAGDLDGDPLIDARNRDHKAHTKAGLRRAPNIVNAHLPALDHGPSRRGRRGAGEERVASPNGRARSWPGRPSRFE
ncbi:hypothetical protein ABT340_19090 [Streptosporangium sp. NPDC000239]|uniref:hypothetical protein n=1 Tax=Streptosporangium sp. NPDC000239 TaxID=3154248 RepID=UPI00332AD950